MTVLKIALWAMLIMVFILFVGINNLIVLIYLGLIFFIVWMFMKAFGNERK